MEIKFEFNQQHKQGFQLRPVPGGGLRHYPPGDGQGTGRHGHQARTDLELAILELYQQLSEPLKRIMMLSAMFSAACNGAENTKEARK